MERLSGLDASFLYNETPTLHMHTLKVAVLDVDPAIETADPSLVGSFFSNGFPDAGRTATIIGHQNVETHLLDLPAVARPSDTFAPSEP